jgi:hypothetical protein
MVDVLLVKGQLENEEEAENLKWVIQCHVIILDNNRCLETEGYGSGS